MAKSCYEYVKSFEIIDKLEPLQWIVLHLHCSQLSETGSQNNLQLREDLQSLLQNAGSTVMKTFKDIHLGYVYDKNFHFLMHKNTTTYKRRGFKLLSNVCSLLSSAFVASILEKKPGKQVSVIPIFDGSIHMLPSAKTVQDYFIEQQLKCHRNNLNKVVLGHLNHAGRQEDVKNHTEGQLNEILFSEFGINYNNEPKYMKKGVCLINGHSIENVSVDFNSAFWDEFPSLRSTESTKCRSYLNLLKRTQPILPHCWVVVRLDGKGFHQFTDVHGFEKPNDIRGINLMNKAAQYVMKSFDTMIMAYGVSDEYSFIIRRYNHREKDAYSLASRVASLFSGAYIAHWNQEFPGIAIQKIPSFDSRVVLYPTVSNLRDYLSWRQADCHINNLYNTCFWKLVQVEGMSRFDAQAHLSGTVSSEKLEILETRLNIDYTKEPALYRKGTVMYSREDSGDIVIDNCDIIGDSFWEERPWLIGTEKKAVSSKNS